MQYVMYFFTLSPSSHYTILLSQVKTIETSTSCPRYSLSYAQKRSWTISFFYRMDLGCLTFSGLSWKYNWVFLSTVRRLYIFTFYYLNTTNSEIQKPLNNILGTFWLFVLFIGCTLEASRSTDVCRCHRYIIKWSHLR